MATKKGTAKKAAPKEEAVAADAKIEEEKVESPEQLFAMSIDSLLGSFEFSHSAAEKLKGCEATVRRFKIKSTAPVEKRFPIRIGMEVINGGFGESNFGIWNVPARLIEQLSRHNFNRQRKIQIVDIEY
jgi:hypothetical protein